MRAVRLMMLISTCMFLSACSLFSPVQYEQMNQYVLTKIPHEVPHKKSSVTTVLVAFPEVVSVYNTMQMAYSTEAYKINYFSKNSWAATPAQMLQPLIVQTLQKTQHFRAVAQVPVVGHYDYVLSAQIIELKQNFIKGYPSYVRFSVRVQIIAEDSNKVIAAKQFSVVEMAPENTPYGGVIAANRATQIILTEIAGFTLHHI